MDKHLITASGLVLTNYFPATLEEDEVLLFIENNKSYHFEDWCSQDLLNHIRVIAWEIRNAEKNRV